MQTPDAVHRVSLASLVRPNLYLKGINLILNGSVTLNQQLVGGAYDAQHGDIVVREAATYVDSQSRLNGR